MRSLVYTRLSVKMLLLPFYCMKSWFPNRMPNSKVPLVITNCVSVGKRCEEDIEGCISAPKSGIAFSSKNSYQTDKACGTDKRMLLQTSSWRRKNDVSSFSNLCHGDWYRTFAYTIHPFLSSCVLQILYKIFAIVNKPICILACHKGLLNYADAFIRLHRRYALKET